MDWFGVRSACRSGAEMPIVQEGPLYVAGAHMRPPDLIFMKRAPGNIRRPPGLKMIAFRKCPSARRWRIIAARLRLAWVFWGNSEGVSGIRTRSGEDGRPKETAPARGGGGAEGRLTSGYAGAARHGSDCELKFCFRAGYFGVPSARGRFRICVLTGPVVADRPFR
jgi:hypothetical protein